MTDTQNEVFKTPVNKIRLFEHGAPGSQNLKLTRKYYTEDMPDGRVKHIVQNITDPDIVPYIPDGIGNSTDRQRIPAVLIIPGGAFRRLVYNFEGEDVAKWLNSMGIAAFVLECRLPSDEHDNAEDVPLIDAMRAMRVIRGRAQEFGIDEAKIGVMGFSAGGFMAALLSTAYESDVYADYKYKDEYDKLSARPDFAVCSYPVISIDDCIEAGKRYMSEEQVLERISDSKAKILHKYNPDKLVRPDMPPVFICETDDMHILYDHPELNLQDAFLLDKVQKGIQIEKKDADRLRALKLVEGRLGSLYLSASAAKSIEDQAGYIKNKGLDDQYYKTLIIEYLKQYTKANRKEIDRLLWDKLPDSLSEVQKKNKIHNLLTSMKNKNLIEKDSDNQQKSNWVLK